VTDDYRITDLLAHALATTRPVDQVVLPRHLVDRLHREMGELTRRAERAEAQLPIRPDGTHHYVSTYCVHGDHAACRRVCKSCPAECQCDCGHPAPAPVAGVATSEEQT
jgi:hypothetical protein